METFILTIFWIQTLGTVTNIIESFKTGKKTPIVLGTINMSIAIWAGFLLWG